MNRNQRTAHTDRDGLGLGYALFAAGLAIVTVAGALLAAGFVR